MLPATTSSTSSIIPCSITSASVSEAFCSAQPLHGGTGAVYVMLRKGERDKQKNREQFQRGRTV